jgi:predicted small lipoprotein YifL
VLFARGSFAALDGMRRFASLLLSHVAAVAMLVSASGCTQRSPLDGPPDANLSYSQVKALAEQTAKANGIELNGYDDPVLSFEGASTKKEWLVYFQMKSPAPPGGHFLVTVDDATSAAEFHPGE